MAEENNEVTTRVGALNLSRIVALAFYWFAIIASVFLGLAFFLLLFGANGSTPFVKFVYETANEFLSPFRGIFPAHPISQTSYFNPSMLFAMIMYLLGAFLIGSFVEMIENRMPRDGHIHSN